MTDGPRRARPRGGRVAVVVPDGLEHDGPLRRLRHRWRQLPQDRRETILVLLAILVGGLLLVILVMALQLKGVNDRTSDVRVELLKLQDAVTEGSAPRASASLATAQKNARLADGHLRHVQWSIAARLPFLGDDVRALRTVTASLVSTTEKSLPPLVKVSGEVELDSIQPRDGRFDLAPLGRLAPVIQSSRTSFRQETAPLLELDTAHLVGPLGKAVRRAQRQIGRVDDVLRRAGQAAAIVPSLLDGRHRYLAVFQNNAETRATGGLPGAWSVLDIDDGRITIRRQGAGSAVRGSSPVARLSPVDRAAFGENLVTDLRDSNLTPDFPRAGRLQQQLMARYAGEQVDGVIALDPVTLGYLLKGLGPVSVGPFTLTPDNAVDVLLNQVYIRYDQPAEQDAFFSAVTRTIFSRLSSGRFDAAELVKAMTRSAQEGRLLVWTSDATVQRRLDKTPVAGRLPSSDSTPAIGVYLNDATRAKMEYYLDTSFGAKALRCTAAGGQTYRVTMRFDSKAALDASELPPYVRGTGFAPRGTILLNIDVVGTPGGTTPVIEYQGKRTEVQPQTIGGRPTSRVAIVIEPGKTVTLTALLASAPGQDGPTLFSTTPTVRSGIVPGRIASVC